MGTSTTRTLWKIGYTEVIGSILFTFLTIIKIYRISHKPILRKIKSTQIRSKNAAMSFCKYSSSSKMNSMIMNLDLCQQTMYRRKTFCSSLVHSLIYRDQSLTPLTLLKTFILKITSWMMTRQKVLSKENNLHTLIIKSDWNRIIFIYYYRSRFIVHIKNIERHF